LWSDWSLRWNGDFPQISQPDFRVLWYLGDRLHGFPEISKPHWPIGGCVHYNTEREKSYTFGSRNLLKCAS
jgi:hypothetical protein